MSLTLKECGHTQTINIINGVCLMKEELLDSTMVHCSPLCKVFIDIDVVHKQIKS